MFLWLFLFFLPIEATAKPFWQSCADAFRFGQPAPEAGPALRELKAWLKGPEMVARMKEGEAHTLKIAKGRGSLKIGIWHRDQRRFVALLLKALKEGSLKEIDAGEIASPKVLILLDRARELAVKENLTFEVKGRFDVSFLRQRAEDHQALPLPPSSPRYWSQTERAALRDAFRHLNLDDCEARGAGRFLLRATSGAPTTFSCQ